MGNIECVYNFKFQYSSPNFLRNNKDLNWPSSPQKFAFSDISNSSKYTLLASVGYIGMVPPWNQMDGLYLPFYVRRLGISCLYWLLSRWLSNVAKFKVFVGWNVLQSSSRSRPLKTETFVPSYVRGVLLWNDQVFIVALHRCWRIWRFCRHWIREKLALVRGSVFIKNSGIIHVHLCFPHCF